jgi:hypothetical protein
MVKLVTTLAFAVALAAPALAKEPQKLSAQAAAAQASVPYLTANGDYAMDPALVVVDGQIVGRDPSPDVRGNLRRIPKPDVQ